MSGEQKPKSFDIQTKEVASMPLIEMIEIERVTYVKEMEDYLENLKKLNKRNKSQAKKKSFENLVKSQIIHENGEFTEHYQCTKVVLQKKG